MVMLCKYSKIVFILIVVSLVSTPRQSHSHGFIQGKCGQKVRASIILNQDIGPCDGVGIIVHKNGIVLDGNGYEIKGIGTDDGIDIEGKKGVTVKNFNIKDFHNGIKVQRGSGNSIKVNSLSHNQVAVLVSSTNTTINNNIIFENQVGIFVNSQSNSIFNNILINNKKQVDDAGGNAWDYAGLGNFWGNYWGQDDGSDGRLAGDYVGDTLLPHEGVDYHPLMDPSIPEQYGGLLCADWWLVWHGGWSPVSIQVEDPYGNIISKNVNDIGENAFYIDDDQMNPDSLLVRVLVHRPCSETQAEGQYLFQMRGLDDLDYYMTTLASQRGEIFLENIILTGSLSKGETQTIDTHLSETVGPSGEIVASAQIVLPIDIKPDSYPNIIPINAAGVIPVAIFSSSTFDVTGIDPKSIYLEAAGVKLTSKKETALCHEEDINSDESIDIMCQIMTDELQIVVGQSNAILQGETYTGNLIRGEDFIKIVSH
jgi:parallel beta-helix repeat protein